MSRPAACWPSTAPSPADPLCLPLTHGEIRFDQGADGAPTTVSALTLQVVDPTEIRRRARAAGLDPDAIRIGGVRFDIIG